MASGDVLDILSDSLTPVNRTSSSRDEILREKVRHFTRIRFRFDFVSRSLEKRSEENDSSTRRNETRSVEFDCSRRSVKKATDFVGRREKRFFFHSESVPIVPTDTKTGGSSYANWMKHSAMKVRPWRWTPFTNSARGSNDTFVLHHWQHKGNDDDPQQEYPFAKFNKVKREK